MAGDTVFPIDVAETLGDVALGADDKHAERHVYARKAGQEAALGAALRLQQALVAGVEIVPAATDAYIGFDAESFAAIGSFLRVRGGKREGGSGERCNHNGFHGDFPLTLRPMGETHGLG